MFSWIKSPIIYSPQGIGTSTDYQSEIVRAMWVLEKGIYPMGELVTHHYKLEDIDQAFQANLHCLATSRARGRWSPRFHIGRCCRRLSTAG